MSRDLTINALAMLVRRGWLIQMESTDSEGIQYISPNGAKVIWGDWVNLPADVVAEMEGE